jgi:hypothetical protein
MKKFRFLYIAAAALLFAACANEEDGIGNNGPVAATVQADISNNIKTRGTADNNSWTAGDAIGVNVTSTGDTTGDNKKYVTTNGDGTFEAADNNNIIYFKDNKETTFSAYYPYSKFLTDGKMNWNIAEVEALEEKYTDIKSKNSPTDKVGSHFKDTKFNKVTHKQAMLSLSNSYNIGAKMAEASGYKLTDVPYESSFAGYKDWFLQKYRRPSYTVEAGIGESPLPLSQFNQIYNDNIGILIIGAAV